MKEAVVLVTILVTLTFVQGQHHRNRHRREWPYTSNYGRDRYSSNVVPRGPNQGEPGLPGLPGLHGPPGPPGICECPEPVAGCAREGAVHMFEFYHDMAGSNVGVGSLAFISNTNDMWLKTRDGWKKIGWLK